MLDIGMVVYVGLIVFALWRSIFMYRGLSHGFPHLNYAAFLYIMMFGVFVYVTINFYRMLSLDVDAKTYPDIGGFWSVSGLHLMARIAPAAVLIMMAVNWYQTSNHISEIQKGSAPMKHDRVVQILAIPTIYGVMALASMLPVLELVAGRIRSDDLAASWQDVVPRAFLPASFLESMASEVKIAAIPWTDAKDWAIWRSETCFYVADLFQAWGIFQFGKLILGHVEETATVKDIGTEDVESNLSELEHDVLESQKAISSLTWVGTSLFIMLCMSQSAMSLWPYFGGGREKQQSIMLSLQIAGDVTSAAAIYNLIVVARVFQLRLGGFSPVPKCLSASFLLWLAFLQKGMMLLGHALAGAMPFIAEVPLLGLVSLSEVQLQLWNPLVVVFECLLMSLLHLTIWRPTEQWYTEEGTENESLVPKVRGLSRADKGEAAMY